MIETGNRTLANLVAVAQQPGEPGRALKYKGEETCEAICLMAQEGAWPAQWCASLGVTVQTLKNWAREYPEFLEALVKAKHLLEAYYLRKVFSSLHLPGLSATIKLLERLLPDQFGPEAGKQWRELGIYGDEEVDQPIAGPGSAYRGRPRAELEAELEALRKRRKIAEEERSLAKGA